MSAESFLIQNILQELNHLKTTTEAQASYIHDEKKKNNFEYEIIGINDAITCIKNLLINNANKRMNSPTKSLEELFDHNSQVKEQLFTLKSSFYPSTNPNIKNDSFIRLINNSIGYLELISKILASEIRTDIQSYIIQFCPQCKEQTYQRINKTTANCVVCLKRNKLQQEKKE